MATRAHIRGSAYKSATTSPKTIFPTLSRETRGGQFRLLDVEVEFGSVRLRRIDRNVNPQLVECPQGTARRLQDVILLVVSERVPLASLARVDDTFDSIFRHQHHYAILAHLPQGQGVFLGGEPLAIRYWLDHPLLHYWLVTLMMYASSSTSRDRKKISVWSETEARPVKVGQP